MKAPGIASLKEDVFSYSKGQAQASGLTLCNEKNHFRDTVLAEVQRFRNRSLTPQHPEIRLHFQLIPILLESFHVGD